MNIVFERNEFLENRTKLEPTLNVLSRVDYVNEVELKIAAIQPLNKRIKKIDEFLKK